MANDDKTTGRTHLPENVQAGGATESRDSISEMTMEQLQRQQDSLIESVGAFRFTLRRMELLEGYRRLLRDLITDCRAVVDKPMAKRIDRTLKDTEVQ